MAEAEFPREEALKKLLSSIGFSSIEQCLEQMAVWESPGVKLSKVDQIRLAKIRKAKQMHEDLMEAKKAAARAELLPRLQHLLLEQCYDPPADHAWHVVLGKVVADRDALQKMIAATEPNDGELPDLLGQLQEILQIATAMVRSRATYVCVCVCVCVCVPVPGSPSLCPSVDLCESDGLIM
jgi:hypothetical protein